MGLDRPALLPGWAPRSLALAAFFAVLAVIVFSTLAPIGLRPQTGHVHAERIAAFLLLGASLATAFPRHWLLTAAVVCALAAGLEFGQTLIPTRHGRLPDAAEKVAGAAAGVLLGFLANRLAERRRPMSPGVTLH